MLGRVSPERGRTLEPRERPVLHFTVIGAWVCLEKTWLLNRLLCPQTGRRMRDAEPKTGEVQTNTLEFSA